MIPIGENWSTWRKTFAGVTVSAIVPHTLPSDQTPTSALRCQWSTNWAMAQYVHEKLWSIVLTCVRCQSSILRGLITLPGIPHCNWVTGSQGQQQMKWEAQYFDYIYFYLYTFCPLYFTDKSWKTILFLEYGSIWQNIFGNQDTENIPYMFIVLEHLSLSTLVSGIIVILLFACDCIWLEIMF